MTTDSFVVLGAGIMAAFNPCGIAMLPSYIVHLLAERERKILDGLWAGLLMTAGFLAVFLLVGFVSMLFTEFLGKAAIWLSLVVGVVFTAMGILMLFGKKGISFHIGGNWNIRKGSKTSILVYGIAYALGSLGCTLPLFSVLVLSSFRSQGMFNGLFEFLLYAFGMGFVVILISIASTISQKIVSDWVRKAARWMGRLSGLITFATGIYLIAYWIPYMHLLF